MPQDLELAKVKVEGARRELVRRTYMYYTAQLAHSAVICDRSCMPNLNCHPSPLGAFHGVHCTHAMVFCPEVWQVQYI